MAKVYCEECEELKNTSPELIVNGFNDEMCTSMYNDTGLNPSDDHNDCDDLHNMNDCLIGNMETELDDYDVCDWKTFMKKYIPNVWTLYEAIICAICGIWVNIHELWGEVEKLWQETFKIWAELDKVWKEFQKVWDKLFKHDCEIEKLTKGVSFYIGESPTDSSYVVAGKGISFLQTSQGDDTHTSDINLNYIGGALVRLAGSLRFYGGSGTFQDEAACYNWDNSDSNPLEPRNTRTRKQNPVWSETGAMIGGGELLYEIRIKKSAYPEVAQFVGGFGQESGGGGYHINIAVYDSGFAPGQHGNCDRETGASDHPEDGGTRGHRVENGWVYIQARMTYIWKLNHSGTKYTPRGFMGLRLNRNGIDC